MAHATGAPLPTSSAITVENVSKSYNGHVVLRPTNCAFESEKTTALIGPSGCGKSTLLRIILGLIKPDTGRVVFDGTPVETTNLQSVRHQIGYVVQDGGLFPHLSAEDNVTLLARVLRKPQADIERRIGELSELVQLSRDALRRYPLEMSGGQRQRVGMMRALMLDPKVVLLDEPLSALDPITRSELQQELKRIFSQLNKTVLMVTHDMHEAAYLASNIVLMRSGSVVQEGTLDDLLHSPREPYVVDFIQAQRLTSF